jgi:hypothetical protein
MAVWQLANCTYGHIRIIPRVSETMLGNPGYFLLSLMSSFVFRAVRDSVPNAVSQERLVGAVLQVLAIADVSQQSCGCDALMTFPWIGHPVCRSLAHTQSFQPACFPFQYYHLVHWAAQGSPVGFWFLERDDPR